MNIIRAILIISVSTLALGGCASTQEYQLYTQGQAQIEIAKYNAEAARYKAMSDIAAGGDSGAKIAAVVALALGNKTDAARSTQLSAPQPAGQSILQWASVLVPALTNGYSIYANTKLGMAQSNNSARVAESTNAAFVGIAGKIQAPVITTPQANVSTNYTLSGTGVLGNGTYSTTTSDYTLSGTGVLGGGSYAPNTLSGTGTVGGGTYNGPVTTPAPVVVTPVVVTPPATPASGSV